MSKITATNLVVGWGQKPVAKLDSIQISAGEIVVIAGPNGAGKSTTIKTLARRIRPLSGSVQIDNQDLFAADAKTIARTIAYVPQIIDTGGKLTVEQLVALGRNPHQQWWSWENNNADKTAIESALQKTDVTHLRHQVLSGLSGGERQRAVIAMALAQEPRIILLDEPTAHLDFKHQLRLLDLLKELSKQDIGLAVVLHDLNLASRLADTVVLLARADNETTGYIEKSGRVAEVFTPETLKRVYQVEVTIVRDETSGIMTYIPTSG